jgi:hypothetical protein
MNKSKVEQGVANYLQAVIDAAIVAGDITAAAVQVLPGKTDQSQQEGIPVIHCILERLPNSVGPLYMGEFRVQVQKSARATEIVLYRAILDVVGAAFPPPQTAAYAAAKDAVASAVASAAPGAVGCGWAITDGGEDVEDKDRWIDDFTFKMGLRQS